MIPWYLVMITIVDRDCYDHAKIALLRVFDHRDNVLLVHLITRPWQI